jgi:hypothetical protein
MKNGHLGLLAFALTAHLAACTRHDGGNDCISRVPIANVPLLSSARLDTVDNLFGSNNLSTSGLQFAYIFYDSVINPVYSGPQIQIAGEQFINGLPLFFGGEAYFSFDKGVFQSPAAGLWQGALPGGDTIGHRSLESLRQAFLQNYKNCATVGGAQNSQPHHPTAPYQDSCLHAILGYIDASYMGTKIPFGQQLIKVWEVTGYADFAFGIAEGISPYPAVFVADSSGDVMAEELAFP